MTIYKKEHVKEYLTYLEKDYWGLRIEVEGAPPNPGSAIRYNATSDQFKEQFTEINFDNVLHEIDHFAAAVKYLKSLKKKAQNPVKSG
jgi:hypothetical protein